LLSDELDEDGELKRPDHIVLDVNLAAVADTVKLGIHHIRKNPGGGSIVVTASASSYQPFPCWDYASAKHGVHGLLRALVSDMGPGTDIPIRINGIAPSWTSTGIVSEQVCAKAGVPTQEPESAARSALILMADGSRHGEMIHSRQGKYFEIESHLLKATRDILQEAPTVEPVTRSISDECRAIAAAGGPDST
jgi:NAD(P)-dependent dehydrogenase (short-subunit alcohol dehydrogenase family)